MKIRKYFVGILAMLGMLSIGFYNSNVITTVFAAEGSSVANTEVNNELELQEAINASVAGQRITLLQNVELTSTLKVASDKDIILDLSGFTISQEYACSSSYSMIKNEGKLTIDGDGLISFKDIGAGDPTYGWGSYTIINSGELTVNSGTIENLSDHNSQGSVVHMYCAIQQGGSNNALTTIEGGKISTPSYRSIRINNGSLVINDGVMEGQIWMQPFAENTSIEINGGEFAPCGVDGSSVFVANSEKTVSLEVTGGEFATKIGASNPTTLVGSVTGGTFTEAAVNGMNSALFSEDFVLVEDENGSYGVLEAVAEIDGTKYASLQSAIDAAQDGETVTLSRNVELNEILVINKSITLDGNGYTLTSTAARAINVSGGVNATIKNITIDASGERGINVIEGASNVTIIDVTAKANNYAVNVAGSGSGTEIEIEGSTLTGLNTVNVPTSDVTVTINNSTINCVDNSDVESYAALAIGTAAERSTITATNTTINVSGDSTKASVASETGKIIINGSEDEVSYKEAYISYGANSYVFDTVEEAIAYAQDGETVVLLKDIELDETVIIAQGKNITLDLAGNTISGTDNSTKNFALISINKGELTIEDSVGEGAITLKATNDNGYSRFSSVVSNNQGILTVKSGTIQHLGGHTMAYAIDSLTNGGSGDVVTTILGGTLKSSYVAIRQFGNSDVNENALLISGGTIEGDNTSIFIQSPNTKQNVISLSISGGLINNRIYGSFEQSNEIDVLVSGGTFANINIVGTEVSLDECLTSGFELAQNVNGKFEVTNAAPESSVAQNGKVSYADLQKAIEAVEDGETITLLKDVTVTTPAYGQNALNIDRAVNFTIDLNGKTLSSDVGNSVVRFNITGANATSDVTVTIKNGKVVSGANTWCALMASAPDASAKAIMNLQDLVVGNSKAGDFAIKAWENSIINATNVAVSSTNCAGGFYAVGGEMVLDNCTVNQKGLHTAPYTSMALGVSNNGKMTVNSGTYSSEPTSAEEGNNQGTSHGSWCAGIMNSGGTLIINGGTFTNGNYGDDSLATYARGLLCLDTGAALTINGGTFNALDSVIYITNNLGDASKNPTAVVKGGKYSTLKNSGYASEMVNYLPDEFLIIGNEADGYVVENENDTIAVAKIGKYGYTTIQKAINAAQVGETVTIFAGQYNETVSVNKDITVVGEDRDQVIINGKLNVTGNGAEVKNLSVTSSGNAVYVNGKDILIENCNIKGSNGLRSCYAKGLVTIKDSTITGDVYGIHFDGSKGGEVVIDNCVITGWTSFASSISKVTIADSKFEEGNYNQLRFYQNAELTNTEFNPEMTIDFGKGGVESSFDGCTVSDGSSLLDVIYLPDIAQMGVKVEVDNQQIIVEAMIGEKTYSTVAEAFEAAVDGDEVEIYVAGTYALSTSGKNITITGAVDGVVFDNIGAKNMGGADVTFNNVTFDYYPNKNYTGLQHSGNLTYNNCTFEGQVFLYGVSETFNECTFNQNSKDAYNVWTYGADAVEFNKCTFNSAGKSVLVYTESKTQFTDLAVENTTFNASEVVDGKAAIEIDTSLSSGANIEIDANTTATGFGSGNVSGNSLWNNKKGNNTDANNDITIKVGDVEVLAPVVFVAKISEIGYTSLADAFAAAVDGNEIILHEDVELADRIDVNAAVILNLNGHKITSTDKNVFNVYADFTVENGTIENTSALGRCVNIRSNVNVVLNGVNLVANKSYNTQPLTIGGSTNGTNVAISNSTIDSGASGYAIIVFVQSNIVVENSTVSGYSVLYVKEGSNGSVIEVVASTLNTENIYSAETNIFGAIVLEDNISITVDNTSNIHVTTTGNQAQYVILSNNSKINESTYVDIQATINLTGDYARIYGLNPAITSALFANNASNIEVLRNEGVLTVETPDGLLVSWSSFVEEYINEFKTAFDAIDKSVYEPKDALELYDIKLAVIESIKAVENNNFLEVEMLVEYGIAALDEVQTKAEKEAAQELEDAKFVACFEIEDSVHVNKAVYAERIKAAKTLQEVEDILEEMKAADVHTSVVDAAVEATCTATGLTEGCHCSVCGEILVAQQVLPVLGHTVVVDTAVAPTCESTGLTEGSHCSVCNEVLVAQQVVSALGHEYKLIDVVRETCTTEGSFTYVCAHDSAHTYKVVIAATGHVEVIDAAVEATCTATGLTEGSHCSVCGEILVAQQEVAKKEHTVVVDAAVEATCTATGLTEGSHCSVCGEILVAQQVLPVLGHNYQQTQIVEATCKEEGHIDYECVTCGDKYSTKIDKASHKYTSVVVSATCTEKGYTIFTCECGDSYVSNEVEALGHNIVDSTIAATCTENGYDVHKCTRCNYELIDNYTNPTGHTFGEWKVVTPANGYEQGLEERECSVCKVVESRNIIDSAFMQLEDAKEAAIVEVKIYAVQQNVDFASHESELIAGINSVDDIANIEKAIKDAKALVDAYVTESFNKSLETEKNNASEAIGNLSSDLDYSQYLSNISSATSLEEVRKQVELAEEASEMYEELNAWFNDYIDALIEDVEAGRIKFSNKAATARDEIVAKLNKTGLSQEDCAEILKLYDEMVAELQNPNSDKNLDKLKNNFQASVEDLVNAKASDVSLTPVYIWLAIITLLIIALGLLVIITSRKNKKEANAILTQEVVEQAPVVEETKEEIVEVQEEVQPQEELSQQEEIEEESEFNFESIEARPYKPFVNRLVDANEQTQEFYNAIKNELLSYKKIRSRISKKYETFRFGRSLMVKLSIAGQTLKLFLALDPNEFERNTYFHKDMSHKKAYQETPLFIRLKSRRSIKRAKELIKIMMEKSNVVVNPKYKEKDYKNELINLVNSILEEHQTN